jgi:putative sigma-54 modulation protein
MIQATRFLRTFCRRIEKRHFYKSFTKEMPDPAECMLHYDKKEVKDFRMKQVIITGNNLLLTEAIKSLTTEKVQKLFRHAPGIIRARVELAFEKNRMDKNSFTARGLLEIGGPDCVASATTEDLYKSIDEMVRKLDTQLRRRVRASAKGSDRLAA